MQEKFVLQKVHQATIATSFPFCFGQSMTKYIYKKNNNTEDFNTLWNWKDRTPRCLQNHSSHDKNKDVKGNKRAQNTPILIWQGGSFLDTKSGARL